LSSSSISNILAEAVLDIRELRVRSAGKWLVSAAVAKLRSPGAINNSDASAVVPANGLVHKHRLRRRSAILA